MSLYKKPISRHNPNPNGRNSNIDLFDETERERLSELIEKKFPGGTALSSKDETLFYQALKSKHEGVGAQISVYHYIKRGRKMPSAFRTMVANVFGISVSTLNGFLKNGDWNLVQEVLMEDFGGSVNEPEAETDLYTYDIARHFADYERQIEEVCREMRGALKNPAWEYDEFPHKKWLEMLDKRDAKYAELVLRDVNGRIIAYVVQCALRGDCFSRLLRGEFRDKELSLGITEAFPGNLGINLYLVATAIRTGYRMEDLEDYLIHCYIRKMRQWLDEKLFKVRHTACVCVNERDRRMMKKFGMKKMCDIKDRPGVSIYHCDGFLKSPSDYLYVTKQ